MLFAGVSGEDLRAPLVKSMGAFARACLQQWLRTAGGWWRPRSGPRRALRAALGQA